MIEAYRKVKTDKQLVIAGGGSDSDEYVQQLRQMAKSDERVLFTGFVQGKMLEELYSNAYIYVLPSDVEGMPLSLLEAMSYGNCCLVSDIPECAEVVQDKGEAFQKGNVDNLTRKLQSLCEEPDRVYKCKGEAREYICNRFHWDDVTKKTLELYQ